MREARDICEFCRQPLDASGSCPTCAIEPHRWTIRDWRPLSVLALVVILGFSFTQMVVGLYRARRSTLATSYYQAGMRAMDAHQPAKAVDAFETALVYSRDNFQYRLRLTDALLANGESSEALAQLKSFWEQRPGDSQVNLKLARLEVRQQHAEDALRYYRNAIEGVWPERTDPVPQRIQVRFELAEYLISLGQAEQAGNELKALAAVLPASSAGQLRLGQLFLKAGNAAEARRVFDSALERATSELRSPEARSGREADQVAGGAQERLAAALEGCIESSFAQGDYPATRHFLERVKPDGKRQKMADDLQRMEALDPFAAKISPRLRRERTVADFHLAVGRLAACGVPFAIALNKGAPPSSAGAAQWSQLANWAQRLAPEMDERRLRGRDDIIESAVRFSFQAESAAQSSCAAPSPDDEALLLLARQRMGAAQ